MNIDLKSFKVSLIFIVVSMLVFVFLLSLILYLWGSDEKVVNISGGVMVAAVFSIFQVFVNMSNLSTYQKYKDLKVKEILSHRDDKEYYRKLIEGCSENIEIMGVTCSRFLNDFADEESENHPFIDALNKKKNLKVKFLIAEKEYLPDNIHQAFDEAQNKMISLKKRFSGKFDFKYYEHAPNHSYVRIDSDVLVGPNFENVSSKNSPAIHIDYSSVYLERYKKYFEDTWKGGKCLR